MPNILSPDVHWIEKDISEFAPAINSSVVGIVGFASKGPTNEAKIVTSPQNLVRLFGQPREDITGQGLEGAIEILEATNQIVFVRASDSNTEANASATVQYGACPAVQVSANGFGVTQHLYLRVQSTDNAGTSAFSTEKIYSIPSGTVGSDSGQGQALAKVIGGSLDSAKVAGIFSSGTSSTGYVVGTWAGSGAALQVSAYSDSNLETPTSALRMLDANGDASGPAVSSAKVWGVTIDTSGFSYVAQSLYPGAGYNAGTKANGDTSGNSVELDALGGQNANLQVNEDGAQSETFKVSLIENADFIEDQINTGTTNAKSDIIKGELFFSGAPASPTKLTHFRDQLTAVGLASTQHGTGREIDQNTSGSAGQGVAIDQLYNPRFIKPIESTYNLAGGNNGIPSSSDDQATALIGDATLDPKTGMQALDDPVLNISIALVPGITTQSVQNALVTLAEGTQEFLAALSPPYAVGTAQDAIDWSNGQTDTRTAAINSSWATIFWPWLKVFVVQDEADRWLDPAIYGARQMVYTDNVAEPWFAAAGSNRGRLTKPTEVEVKTNKGDRDALYTGGNVVNPIAVFPQRGIMVFGNKTTQRRPTALQSTNIRRLLIQLRKVVLAATRDFLFEPNDEFTWERIENVVNPILDDIARRRGIVTVDGTPQYNVVCDETTNTPARVDRNELWCRIILKPTKTAENIVFEVNLTNQGAQIGGS